MSCTAQAVLIEFARVPGVDECLDCIEVCVTVPFSSPQMA